MKRRKIIGYGLLLLLALFLSACGGAASPEAEPTSVPPPTEAPAPPPEVEISGSVSGGGLLYDKWWKAAGVDEPSGDNPLWARQDTNTRTDTATWRCKECHGWDYQGAEGAYGSGSHFTGFPGILSAQNKSIDDLVAQISGAVDPDHDYSAMGEQAIQDLAIFITQGLVDLTDYIDYEAKAPLAADAEAGDELFDSTCSECHGADGRKLNFGGSDDPEFVGTIALDNPWEFIHKVRAGQPGTSMPSAIDSGWSIENVMNVLAYAQTLPPGPPEPTAASSGGRLYDKWWKEAGVDEPSGDNPLWARQDTNTRTDTATWRCKECHGWDYQGAEGAYGSGSHFTGFPGILNAQDKSIDDLVAMISGAVDPDHDYSAMGEQAIQDLAVFINKGLVDLTDYIDYEAKAPLDGDAEEGEEIYEGSCAACHGDDGRLINFGGADDPEFVGTIALDNPWEFIHKVRAGQPGTGMPSAIDGGWSMQDVIDVLTFAQTLPTEAP